MKKSVSSILSFLCSLALVGAAGVVCDSDTAPVTVATFDISGGGAAADLFSIPYPNNLRVKSDGTLDLAHLARLKDTSNTLPKYVALVAANATGGFGLNSGAFFRFSAPVARRCLPSEAASVKPGASVFWVNITKGSSEYGKQVPLRFSIVDKALTWNFGKDSSGARLTGTYLAANSLAVLPVPGFPLLPKTTYAVVVSETLCDDNGNYLQADADFAAIMRDSAPGSATLTAAHKVYAPLRAFLKDKGITGVATAAVFTTCDATALAGKARAVVHNLAAPKAETLEAASDGPNYWELQGTYKAPNFQHGTVPYLYEGGGFKLDASGTPQVARTETMRFAVSVPKATMPKDGWPVVIYAHGTGGSYRTFLRNHFAEYMAEVKDAQGKVVANVAMVGIDQVLHGPRGGGGSPELSFFNFINPTASIHNMIQAGVDDFSLLRLVKGLSATSVKWTKGHPIYDGKTLTFSPGFKFDPKRIYFMGHSQGGITGPIFLAHEPEVKGAVLSAAGGMVLLTLLEKLDPLPLKTQVEQVLGAENVTRFHPMLTLVQQLLEPADTINYGRMLLKSPPSGGAPKHIFMSQGVVDQQTPNSTGEALAAAIGLPRVGGSIIATPALDLAGLSPTTAPLSGNLTAGTSKVTGGLVQYRAKATGKTCTSKSECGSGGVYCDSGTCRRDGHYVLFDLADGKRQWTSFLATMARDGTPTIVK